MTPRLSIPAPALVLGLGGIIPFVGSAGVYAFGDPRLAGPALLALLPYAAAILSFLGGVRWGAETVAEARPRWTVMVGAVLPALVGWGLLAAPFTDPAIQLGGFIAAFLAVWAWDARSTGLPPWYRALRVPLTLGALAGLSLALWRALAG